MHADVAALQAARARQVLAVFDLDGTLTRGDTLFAFLRFVTGPGGFLLSLARALPALVGLVLGLVPNDRAKKAVLRVFLDGMPSSELGRLGQVFARERLPAMMRPRALERLAEHRAQGHFCLLLSASPAVYVRPWGLGAGFDEVIATELRRDALGRVTGELDGANCRGVAKVRRLEERFGNLGQFTIYGYGDSRADRPFLARCTEAHYRPFRGLGDDVARNAAQKRPRDLLKLMRPHQWAKNAFVFIGLIFGHAWNSPPLLVAAVLAAAAFSLAASAVYIVNDYKDRARDRLHPSKRHRPLASRRVEPWAALGLAAVLALIGGALAFAAGKYVLLLVTSYAAMNLAYSFGLKSVVLLDIFMIAAGFMLRILAGTLGIGIPPSQWLLFCGFLLTLFLGFTKRRAEILSLSEGSLAHREVLSAYGTDMLDKLISICAGCVIMSYSLYTMSPDTVRIHGTTGLIYTVPFVIYGIFRYLYLLHGKRAGTDTARDLSRDPHMLVAVVVWLITTFWLISG